MTTTLNPSDITSSAGTPVFLPTEIFKRLSCITIAEVSQPDALGLIPSHYLAGVVTKYQQGSFHRLLFSVIDAQKTGSTGFVVQDAAFWRLDDPSTRNLDLHIYSYYTTLAAAYKHFSGDFSLQISSVGDWIKNKPDA